MTPLNPGGGSAVLVAAKVTDDASNRLAELAYRTGMKRSDLIRLVLALGIQQAERELDGADTGPPVQAA